MSSYGGEGTFYGVFITADLARELVELIERLETFESTSPRSMIAAVWYQLDDSVNVDIHLRITHLNSGSWLDQDYHAVVLLVPEDSEIPPPPQFQIVDDRPAVRPVLLGIEQLNEIMEHLRNIEATGLQSAPRHITDELVFEGETMEDRSKIEICFSTVSDHQLTNNVAAVFYSEEPGTKNWNDELDLWRGSSLRL